ncbi:hypothetical protein L7F22_068107 [Adiantum nelumboides]|nr:hypothetical protein [Adiantum nelumboides]
MGNNNGGTSGGSGSSGGSSSDKGSSSSGSNSGSNNSGGSSGGSNSGGSSSSSGGSSNSGSNSSGSNSGSNNSGSSSHNSGSSGSSSGNTSSGSGSSGNNNNNDSGSENNNSNQSHNSGSSSSSNDSSSNSNQNSGTAEKSTSNNDSNGSTPATPVTLSNGAVVTPIAIVDQSSTGLNGLGTNTASQSILVVMTNSQGEKVTSTLAYDSSIAAIAASATNSPTIKDQTNTGTNEIKNLNGTTKSSSTNVGMIAGPVIAVLICAIGALTLFFCLRRKRRARTSISSYGNTTPSRSLRRFIPTFRSPRFGAIRLPSLPSFNLHNTSPTSPEMVQPFNTVISRPSSGLVSPMDYVGRKRVSPNDIQEANRMSSNGLQITGINNSPRNSDRSISVPESVYFSPSQTHHPRLNSINDAINSGELTYDDDASSIGHESQGVGYAGSESAERRSYASTMLFSRAIGHSESHKALSSMVNLDEGQDPFSSPIQDNRKSFEIIQSENSPKSFQSSFQANESVMSRDTFGIPSSPMSERSDSNYGFANPGIPSTLSAQIGNKALLSPFRNLLGRSDVQTFSSFTSIVEEENDSQKGIPDQIKNDLERKRQLSIFRRGDQ